VHLVPAQCPSGCSELETHGNRRHRVGNQRISAPASTPILRFAKLSPLFAKISRVHAIQLDFRNLHQGASETAHTRMDVSQTHPSGNRNRNPGIIEMCAHRNQMLFSERESSLSADHSTVNSSFTYCAAEAVCQMIRAKRKERRVHKEARGVRRRLEGWVSHLRFAQNRSTDRLPLHVKRPSFRLVRANGTAVRHCSRIGIASLGQ
jgi:hypothetical protein